MNRQLSFVNNHQTCELQGKYIEIETLKKACEELHVKFCKKPHEFEQELAVKQEEILTLKQQNKNVG